jgi:hypothetical protein
MIGFAIAAAAAALAATPSEGGKALAAPIPAIPSSARVHFVVRDETITEEEYRALQADPSAKTSGRYVTPFEAVLGNNGVYTAALNEAKRIESDSSVQFERVSYRVTVIRTPTGAELVVRDGRDAPETTQVLTFGFDGKETTRAFATRDVEGKVEHHLLRAFGEQM